MTSVVGHGFPPAQIQMTRVMTITSSSTSSILHLIPVNAYVEKGDVFIISIAWNLTRNGADFNYEIIIQPSTAGGADFEYAGTSTYSSNSKNIYIQIYGLPLTNGQPTLHGFTVILPVVKSGFMSQFAMAAGLSGTAPINPRSSSYVELWRGTGRNAYR